MSCLLILLLMMVSCSQPVPEEPNQYHLIPLPQKVVTREGKFHLKADTKIILTQQSEETGPISEFLRQFLKEATGHDLEIMHSSKPENGSIFLTLDPSQTAPEGYTLKVDTEQVTISAKAAAGLFYGVQTMRQLLPVAVEGPASHDAIIAIPNVAIEDTPRFSYRGMMLDVARHFYTVDEIKQFIELLVMHKMNIFHWHLTDDQGWRIEIKKYPKLTEIGAWRKETRVGHAGDGSSRYDGKRYGGFYSQEDIKEIVTYAKKKFVTVIPEIEMPGHSQAALAAYPKLACNPGPYEVSTTWGVHKEVYCPKEEAFGFLEEVLKEVFALFPSKYIHIGGDECPKDRWKECLDCQTLIQKEGLEDEHELQCWFITRMEKFINDHGRKIIGWDEILEGGLAPNATVMSWRGVKGGIEAAKQKHDVIMTPTSHCYFDYYQSEETDKEPLAIGGFLNVQKVYSYEPVPDELTGDETKYILGAQGNVWTEYIPTYEHVQYMVLPRMTALSEVVWSDKQNRNWDDFKERLKVQLKRFDAAGINYAKHSLTKPSAGNEKNQ
ncbi:beta-N-acetylhexosaminidase [Fulvivirga sp. M361]|nr:beta-N-acetylhexosaminidase [Fulvivirga sp. M361]